MVKVENLAGGTRVSGYGSREEAEAQVQTLRRQWSVSHGFWLVQPVELADDGTWKFMWAKGSHCD